MYHPYILTYCEIFKDRNLYAQHPLEVKQILTRSLSNPKEVMEVTWVCFRLALTKHRLGEENDFPFSEVYSDGWDFSEDTKRLKNIVREMVEYGQPKKELREYL